ncbi:MAG: hypothetical protein ACKVKM_10815 [Verrucomicrobiia bacterium]|jgi:hypothetical protein
MKHLFFALFSLIFLAGCEKKKEAEPQDQAKASAKPVAPVSKQEPPKTSPKNTPKTSPKTTVKKPGTVLWEFETGGVVFSSPAIGSDGTVYVGSVDKKLYAIKIDSKSPWPMRGQNPQHTGRAP